MTPGQCLTERPSGAGAASSPGFRSVHRHGHADEPQRPGGRARGERRRRKRRQVSCGAACERLQFPRLAKKGSVSAMHRVTRVDADASSPRATRPLSTVVKALALLDFLAGSDGPVRVSSLARAVGASRGEVHRQLVTLEAAGWMEQLPDGSYRLTLRPAHLGHTALRQAGVAERTAPLLAEAARACGEVVSIAVLDGDTARVVQRAEPGRPLRATLLPGDRLGLCGSAAGRLLCALAEETTLATAARRGVPLPPAGDLAVIRSNGWATSADEAEDGIFALAVPLRREDGEVVAALSVHGPQERLTPTGALAVLRPLARRVEPLLRLDGAAFGMRA